MLIPRCADPGGVYADYITATYQIGDNARAAKGLGGLLHATSQLKQPGAVEAKLTPEVRRAIG